MELLERLLRGRVSVPLFVDWMEANMNASLRKKKKKELTNETHSLMTHSQVQPDDFRTQGE